MSRYARAGGGPLVASQEFKQMVKALHDAGIEVLQLYNTVSLCSKTLFLHISIQSLFMLRN